MDECKNLESVQTSLRFIMEWCQNNGIEFDAALKSIRDEPQLIRMDRKYRTKGGDAVTILTVTAPNPSRPVIGYKNRDGLPEAWTATGVFNEAVRTFTDLMPAENQPITSGKPIRTEARFTGGVKVGYISADDWSALLDDAVASADTGLDEKVAPTTSKKPTTICCSSCAGTGAGKYPYTCSYCDGTGSIYVVEGYGYPASNRGQAEIADYFRRTYGRTEK